MLTLLVTDGQARLAYTEFKPEAHHVAATGESASDWWSVLLWLAPLGLLVLIWNVTLSRAGQRRGAAAFGGSRAKIYAGTDATVTFAAVAVLFVAPSIAAAQTSPFFDLALRVNVGDQLEVKDTAGATTAGRLVGLTPTEITLQTASGERRFGVGVVSISVRDRSTRKAVLIGAGLGAAMGLVMACTSAEREECGDAGLILGAVGAGAGVLYSVIHPGWSTVYSAGGAPIATAPGGAPGPLNELALHVNLGDQLRVRDRSGVTINGRLTGLTGTEITLETESGEARVAAIAVRAVTVRHYALGQSALLGGVLFTALAFAAPACRENPDCVPIAAAPLGAGVGLAIGALVPRQKTVFRADEPRVAVAPVLSLRSVGVRATLRW
jgi:hypothetical protein